MLRFGQGLYVEQCPQCEQCINGDFGTVCFAQAIADPRVKHPTRYGQASLFVNLDDERFIVLASQTPDAVDRLAIIGMISVVNSKGIRFMSSVLMPVALPTPRISCRQGCRCISYNACSATRTSTRRCIMCTGC